MTSKRKA